MSIRLTPSARDLFQRFSPAQNPAPSEPVQATSEKRVTARLESTVEGVCPYCQNPMRKSRVSLGEVWLCEEDRHVVPVRNA